MKISLKWLNEFVEIEDYASKVKELSDLLTFAGFEVESIEEQAKKYEFVVTGLILKKDPHPEADRLTVCQVTTGNGIVHQIVCGAKNHKENDRVVVALPGAKLPNGLEIKETILRNQVSKGMLCSAAELGLAEDSDGILILGQNTPIGVSFAEYYGLNDTILELKVTPNRADCLSHLGLAREIAGLLGRKLKPPAHVLESQLLNVGMGENPICIEVQAIEDCPVYMGAYLESVKVGPSPKWLMSQLEKLGLKSINNVVDVTNYVMLERGQPLHAFDFDQITHSQIRVRPSFVKEKFVSLDGTSYELPEGVLCIADSNRVLALAGVVGGQNSGVTDKTQKIFLEAAVFKSDKIRKTSRILGIQTDSAYRFSRGVDATSVRQNLLRAIQLLSEVADAKWVGGVVVGNNQVKQPHNIFISVDFVSQKLGYPVTQDEFVSKMKQLGCHLEDQGEEERLAVCPPAFRFDLEQPVDLVEEFARLNGYDKIPESLPSQAAPPKAHQKEYLFQRRLAEAFTSHGFNELVLPLFIDPKLETQFFGASKSLSQVGWVAGESVTLINPLSEDQAGLRRQLSYGLLDRAIYNLRQGLNQGQLFEIGVVAFKTDSYQEGYHLSAVSWGEPQDIWSKKQDCPFVIRFKDKVIKAFESLGIALNIEKVGDRSELPDFLHMGQSAWLSLNQERVGFIGHIHPSWADEHKVRVPLCVMELRLDSVLKLMGQISEYRAFSRYPYVERDLSLVVPRNLASQTLEVYFQKSLNKYLQGIELFDIYEGEKLPEGHRQLGYRLRLQKKEGTLSDTEVNEVMNELLSNLRSDLGVQLREA